MKIGLNYNSNKSVKLGFQAKIDAPKYFWSNIKNVGKIDNGSTASELTRIYYKPNSENDIIKIKYNKGYFVAILNSQQILKEKVTTCTSFLNKIADTFAPLNLKDIIQKTNLKG